MSPELEFVHPNDVALGKIPGQYKRATVTFCRRGSSCDLEDCLYSHDPLEDEKKLQNRTIKLSRSEYESRTAKNFYEKGDKKSGKNEADIFDDFIAVEIADDKDQGNISEELSEWALKHERVLLGLYHTRRIYRVEISRFLKVNYLVSLKIQG